MSCGKSFVQNGIVNVTVITVCYNEKYRIKKTIENVSDQTYPYIEHLIIDGGSTDGTVDIVREFSKKRRIDVYSEKDHGIYNAMNRGIARANGDYIFFLNAGDIFYNERVIADMVSYIKEDMDTIYYGMACLVGIDGLKRLYTFPQEKMIENLLNGSMPCHQTIFAPKKFLTNHYFKEQYKIRADYEWFMYWISRRVKCKSVPIIVCYYDAKGASGRIKNSSLLLQEQSEIIDGYQNKILQNGWVKEQKEIKKEDVEKINEQFKYYYMFQLMNRWMILKENNIRIGAYLQRKKYKHISIYGMGSLGLRLIEDLRGYDITIDYAVDRNANSICVDLPILLPNMDFPKVDIMVVTAVTYFNEIEERLKKRVRFPFISLEDLIYEAEEIENFQG